MFVTQVVGVSFRCLLGVPSLLQTEDVEVTVEEGLSDLKYSVNRTQPSDIPAGDSQTLDLRLFGFIDRVCLKR